MRTLGCLLLLTACGGRSPNAESPEGAMGLWLTHDGLSAHITDRLTDLPPIGITTPLGVAVAQIHSPTFTSESCGVEDQASCMALSVQGLVSLDAPPFASVPNIPLAITAKGEVAFAQDHPQALRLRMPDPAEVTLELGAGDEPATAFLIGLLEGMLVPQINEYLQTGLLIEPAPFVSTYLDEMTVNNDGVGVLSTAMNTPPTMAAGSHWRACANGQALTHLLFPSMLLEAETPKYEVTDLWRAQDRLYMRVQKTGDASVRPTLEASVQLTMESGMLTIDDVELGWERRPRGIWFGPNIRRLEQTLDSQTPYSLPLLGPSSALEVQDWTAEASVVCVTGS